MRTHWSVDPSVSLRVMLRVRVEMVVTDARSHRVYHDGIITRRRPFRGEVHRR
jgi:hypothetical protein